MDLNELVQRIGYFRNKINLSARELSLRIGKSETYINQVECRNFTVSLPVLFEIIEALEITCAEFYSDNYVAYKQDKEILDTLNALPAERKNSFLDLIKNTK
ncbi:MAG: helix-turn-helix domain-containing protein [Coriobacteriales bacterium]|jgi:DNA-binding helix-turn-helix protein